MKKLMLLLAVAIALACNNTNEELKIELPADAPPECDQAKLNQYINDYCRCPGQTHYCDSAKIRRFIYELKCDCANEH